MLFAQQQFVVDCSLAHPCAPSVLGWWVARSSRAIGALISADFPPQGVPELQQQHKQQRQQQQVQQQQVKHEQPHENAQQQQHADISRCLVPVRVQVVGKGVAQPGAKMLSHGGQSWAKVLSHGPGSPYKPTKRQRKAVIPDRGFVQAATHHGQGSQAVPVKDTERDLSKLDTAADVLSSQAMGAAATTLSQGVFDANELDLASDTEGVRDLGEDNNSRMQPVVGIVTSGVTRGVSSDTAALALCSLAALQPAQREQQQAWSKLSLDSAMQMQCPASTAVRDVVVCLQHSCA